MRKILLNLLDFLSWIGLLLFQAALMFAKVLNAGLQGFWGWSKSRDGLAFWNFSFFLVVIAILLVNDQWRFNDVSNAENEPKPRVISRDSTDPVVAQIDLRRVRLSDVIEYAHQAQKLPEDEILSLDEVFDRKLVEETIDQILLSEAAEKSGLPADLEVQAKLRAARGRILSSSYLEQKVDQFVTEEAARELYNKQRANLSIGVEVRLSKLVVADENTAKIAYDALGQGTTFSEAVKGFSTDEASRSTNGNLGYFRPEELSEEIKAIIAPLAVGDISPPVSLNGQWVIYKVTNRRSIRPPSFEKLKDGIVEFLTLKVINDTMEELRREASITIFEPFAESPVESISISPSLSDEVFDPQKD